MPKLSAQCNVSWPTRSWPPKPDAKAKAHELRGADVPAGMHGAPVQFATNTPDLDELAVGFPRVALAEISYADPGDRGSGISEIVGRAPTPAVASAAYRRARDVIFGSCVRYWSENGPSYPRHALAERVPNVFAYQTVSGSSYNSDSAVVVVGYRGEYVFEVRVHNFVVYPATGTTTYPTDDVVVAALRAALARASG